MPWENGKLVREAKPAVAVPELWREWYQEVVTQQARVMTARRWATAMAMMPALATDFDNLAIYVGRMQ